jgi:hypothetical protein
MSGRMKSHAPLMMLLFTHPGCESSFCPSVSKLYSYLPHNSYSHNFYCAILSELFYFIIVVNLLLCLIDKSMFIIVCIGKNTVFIWFGII